MIRDRLPEAMLVFVFMGCGLRKLHFFLSNSPLALNHRCCSLEAMAAPDMNPELHEFTSVHQNTPL